MDELESKHSWKEANFDTILMYLRTILLRRKSLAVFTTKHEVQD